MQTDNIELEKRTNFPAVAGSNAISKDIKLDAVKQKFEEIREAG